MGVRSFVHHALRPTGFDIVGTRQRFMDPFQDQVTLLDNSAPVIIDAGANIGAVSAEYRNRFPDATIYAFEPFEESYRALSERFKADRNIRPQRFALGDREGSRNFFINASSGTNSLLRMAANGGYAMGDEGSAAPVGKIDIHMTTLDAFCVKEGISNIDILKMDIQGAELLALCGAEDLLLRRSVRLIYAEVLFAKIYEEQAFLCDLWSYLSQRGYELYGLYNVVRGGGGYVSFGDAVFLPSRVRQFSTSGPHQDETSKELLPTRSSRPENS